MRSVGGVSLLPVVVAVFALAGVASSASAAPALRDSPAGPTDATGTLYALVAERLGFMRDVAAFKWLHGDPLQDLRRERLVIEAAVAAGLRRGIQEDTSARFFRAQIEAAKDIQGYWFERWAAGSPPQVAPDLAADIRPALLRLGTAIIDQSVAAGLEPSAERFFAAVEIAGLSDARKAELFEALTGLRTYASRLEQILATGKLRVGTTGDYAPFSYSDSGDKERLDYSGVDIDLARDLAGALGVELQLVETSWPGLLDDLVSGAYDVAMSGVSRTLVRARHGYFSIPYFVGGKTPIARCEDQAKFPTLASIDQPGVRIIVNPGGTNEAFVDTRIEHASKVLFDDNRSIFAALAAGKADVMITDRIEVTLQTRRIKALCATMSETLTYQEKGFLMPKDDPLRSFVDVWIGLRLGDGTVDDLFAEHLAKP